MDPIQQPMDWSWSRRESIQRGNRAAQPKTEVRAYIMGGPRGLCPAATHHGCIGCFEQITWLPDYSPENEVKGLSEGCQRGSTISERGARTRWGGNAPQEDLGAAGSLHLIYRGRRGEESHDHACVRQCLFISTVLPDKCLPCDLRTDSY